MRADAAFAKALMEYGNRQTPKNRQALLDAAEDANRFKGESDWSQMIDTGVALVRSIVSAGTDSARAMDLAVICHSVGKAILADQRRHNRPEHLQLIRGGQG